MAQVSNASWWERAQKVMPGGVNSPVRSFKSVPGDPLFFRSAKGCRFTDEDGKSYIDWCLSWGPLILGHADPDVHAAALAAMNEGASFGAPSRREVLLAEAFLARLPHFDQVRFVSSGTEAVMSAIRLARGFTGRDVTLKFSGCYHGHSDSLLVKAGSGMLTFGNPSSAGVPADLARHTLVLDYNDTEGLHDAFANEGDRIAGVIVEPVAGNMNLVAPRLEFLTTLRDLCTRYGAMLIFDEVMTGFRVGLGSAQGLYGITPDLSTFGKIIGGGMPLGAFGGRREIMEKIAPLGPVYQAGTLSGNPLSVAAGLATLQQLQAPGFYAALSDKTRTLTDGLTAAAQHHGVPFSAQAIGGMFGLYFAATPPATYAEVMAMDAAAFNTFYHAMLDLGIYLAPSAFEAGFVSAAHTPADLAATLAAADQAFAMLKK